PGPAPTLQMGSSAPASTALTVDLERNCAYLNLPDRCPGEPLAGRCILPHRWPRRPRPGRRHPSPEPVDAGARSRRRGRVRGLTMDAPLYIPSTRTPASSYWRGISIRSLVRKLLGIREEKQTLASTGRGVASLGSAAFDWDDPDTSLTQADLEVLK